MHPKVPHFLHLDPRVLPNLHLGPGPQGSSLSFIWVLGPWVLLFLHLGLGPKGPSLSLPFVGPKGPSLPSFGPWAQGSFPSFISWGPGQRSFLSLILGLGPEGPSFSSFWPWAPGAFPSFIWALGPRFFHLGPGPRALWLLVSPAQCNSSFQLRSLKSTLGELDHHLCLCRGVFGKSHGQS